MLQPLFLGAVQGLTEFVPISSSAHLILVPFLLRWPVPDLSFDVAVHLGTLLAVLVYFAGDLSRLLTSAVRTITGRGSEHDRGTARVLMLLLVGSIPAGIAGVLVEGLFEDLFTTSADVDRIGAPITAIGLVGTAVLLSSAELVYRRRAATARGLEQLGIVDALVIGLSQAMAIVPGISRSGATIGAGVFRGLSRETAARFSFLLSIPAILGAALVALPDLPPDAPVERLVGSAVAAAVVGFASIAFLMRYLRTRTMWPFAAYCVALGAVAVGFWLALP
ncbi:MAG: undecaprenyl-diphosphate phosphatase [Actinomycetota bacterium]